MNGDTAAVTASPVSSFTRAHNLDMDKSCPSVSPGKPNIKYIFTLRAPHSSAIFSFSIKSRLVKHFPHRLRSSSSPLSGAMVTLRRPKLTRALIMRSLNLSIPSDANDTPLP
jgi:hypothetical protein